MVGRDSLAVASLFLALALRKRLTEMRKTLDAGANASVLPALNTASLVGFGAVWRRCPRSRVVSDAFLVFPGGPLVCARGGRQRDGRHPPARPRVD